MILYCITEQIVMLRYTQVQFFIHFRPNREQEPSLGNDALHKHTMHGVF